MTGRRTLSDQTIWQGVIGRSVDISQQIADEAQKILQSLMGQIPRLLRRNEVQRPKRAVERSRTTKCVSGVK